MKVDEATLRRTISKNIAAYRKAHKDTQAGLAEKLNYSDKSVSKWERAEAAPDAAVLRNIADVFGVTVDRLVYSHDELKAKEERKKKSAVKFGNGFSISYKMITSVAIMGIWTVALLIFIIFWLNGKIIWQLFPCALPVSLVTQLVLHSVWGKGKYNIIIVSALQLSLIMTVYFLFFSHNWWQLFLLALPVEIIVILVFRIKRRPSNKITHEKE